MITAESLGKYSCQNGPFVPEPKQIKETVTYNATKLRKIQKNLPL